MKFIDNLFGKAICRILTIHDAILGKADGVENHNTERILLIKFFGIGSIIYISPSIRVLKDKYPRAKISFLTFAEHKDLCEMIDGIDDVITFKIKGLINLIIDVPLLIFKLRKGKFDRVYNFEFHARFPTIVSYLSGAREMIEFHSDFFYKGDLRSKKIPYTLDRHVISSFMDMVSDNHTGLSNPSIKLNIPESDEKYIDTFLAGQGFNPALKKLLIGVNINTSGMAYERRWHIEKFAGLVELLIKSYDAYIFLTGGKGDFDYVNLLKEVFKDDKRVINSAGKLSLKQLAAFYKRCDLVISNDSGPLHVAEAVKTKTISLFGPETPKHYGPIGENHIVIYKGLPCSPCLSPLNMKSANCKIGVECMESITVDEVFSAVRGVLK